MRNKKMSQELNAARHNKYFGVAPRQYITVSPSHDVQTRIRQISNRLLPHSHPLLPCYTLRVDTTVVNATISAMWPRAIKVPKRMPKRQEYLYRTPTAINQTFWQRSTHRQNDEKTPRTKRRCGEGYVQTRTLPTLRAWYILQIRFLKITIFPLSKKLKTTRKKHTHPNSHNHL